MRAANSWLGPDGQCASIAGSRGVFCEKGLHGPVAADPQGDSYVQQLACEEDRPFSRYLLNRAGRYCAAADEQKPESALRTSIDRTLERADRRRKPPSSRSARGLDRAEPNVRTDVSRADPPRVAFGSICDQAACPRRVRLPIANITRDCRDCGGAAFFFSSADALVAT